MKPEQVKAKLDAAAAAYAAAAAADAYAAAADAYAKSKTKRKPPTSAGNTSNALNGTPYDNPNTRSAN